MRIGTKSLLGSCSSRLVSGLFTPWALVLHHPLSRLWSRTYSSPSTSPSPSAPNSFGESFASFIYVMIWFWLSALQIPWRITWNTSIFYFLWFSSWCEDRSTRGKDLALDELGEETEGPKTAKMGYFWRYQNFMQIGSEMAALQENPPKMDPKKRFFWKIPQDF